MDADTFRDGVLCADATGVVSVSVESVDSTDILLDISRVSSSSSSFKSSSECDGDNENFVLFFALGEFVSSWPPQLWRVVGGDILRLFFFFDTCTLVP